MNPNAGKMTGRLRGAVALLSGLVLNAGGALLRFSASAQVFGLAIAVSGSVISLRSACHASLISGSRVLKPRTWI